MTPDGLLAALDRGHVLVTFERQRRYAITATEPHGPILFITVSEESDEPSLEDAYIVDEDLHEHPLTAAQRIAITRTLRHPPET